MTNDIHITEKRRQNRIFAGVILIGAGMIFLLSQFNLVFLPYWVLSWPMAMIGVGLLLGIRSNFRSRGWFYLVLIGGLFLITFIFPSLDIVFLWPLLLIAAGLRMLLVKEWNWRGHFYKNPYGWKTDLHGGNGHTTL